MRIKSISIYAIHGPMSDPALFSVEAVEPLVSLIVCVEADDNLQGWGEACPLGASLRAGETQVAIAAFEEFAPGLIGLEIRNPYQVYDALDGLPASMAYLKSMLDCAVWDLLGKSSNKPLHALLGRRERQLAKCYCTIASTGPDEIPEAMSGLRQKGYRQFQLKIGRTGEVAYDVETLRVATAAAQDGEVIVADANRRMSVDTALETMSRVRDLDFHLEQPCETYEECREVGRAAAQPLMLDECIWDLAALRQAITDDVFAGITSKITRVGGLTIALKMRELCEQAGKLMNSDDCYGADISVAMMAHLAVTIPAANFFATYSPTASTGSRYDRHAATGTGAQLAPLDLPGLGVSPDPTCLGAPICVFE